MTKRPTIWLLAVAEGLAFVMAGIGSTVSGTPQFGAGLA